MKRTSLLLSGWRKLQTPRGGTKRPKFFATLAGLALAGLLAMPVFAAKNYKATIAPTNVSAGTTNNFTLTVTNCDAAACPGNATSPESQAIGSIDVSIPAGLSSMVLGTVSATGTTNQGGPNVWHAHLDTVNNKIRLRPGGAA
ncbi:MAG: hypothetical protein ACRD88_16130, partial [Terriglobia bacterium]